VDARLVVGSAVFGVGWGLSGYCPGPGVVALASGAAGAFVFVAALLVGSFFASRFDGARRDSAVEKDLRARASV
jgi:uncharacterized membrane protein YedE/YeeE